MNDFDQPGSYPRSWRTSFRCGHTPIVATMILTGIMMSAGNAAAEETVPVRLEPGGEAMILEGPNVVRCETACILHINPGNYRVTTGADTENVTIREPVRLTRRPPVRWMKMTGATMMLVGGASALVTGAAALNDCAPPTRTDIDGRTTVGDACSGPEASGKLWMIGAGVGLTTAVVGAVFFFMSLGGVRVKHDPKLVATPTLDQPGLSLVGRF